MYFRTIKIPAILLKWHRLLALHGTKCFPGSISSAVQQDPDPSWGILLFHYCRFCRDYWQKSQMRQKFRVNTGLPTSRHVAEETRGDKTLRAFLKNSGGKRDVGMPMKAVPGGKRGVSRMFESCWLFKGHQMLDVTGTDCQRRWEKPQINPKAGIYFMKAS